ncbi:hypothetical protein KCU65_g10009, partial [Aureobasidium melanogenum]
LWPKRPHLAPRDAVVAAAIRPSIGLQSWSPTKGNRQACRDQQVKEKTANLETEKTEKRKAADTLIAINREAEGNLKSQQIHDTAADRSSVEKAFFRDRTPWNKLDKELVGDDALGYHNTSQASDVVNSRPSGGECNNNPRRTNMMKDEPEFDEMKKIEEKDGITWKQVIDKSPAWTYHLAKGT